MLTPSSYSNSALNQYILATAPWIKETLSRNLDEIIVAALVDRHTEESGVLVLMALARCLGNNHETIV